MDEDEEQDVERAAELETEAVDALRTLMEEYDYSQEDIERMVKGAVFDR